MKFIEKIISKIEYFKFKNKKIISELLVILFFLNVIYLSFKNFDMSIFLISLYLLFLTFLRN